MGDHSLKCPARAGVVQSSSHDCSMACMCHKDLKARSHCTQLSHFIIFANKSYLFVLTKCWLSLDRDLLCEGGNNDGSLLGRTQPKILLAPSEMANLCKECLGLKFEGQIKDETRAFSPGRAIGLCYSARLFLGHICHSENSQSFIQCSR